MARGLVAPLLVLLAYGVAFAAAALGGSPPAFDDHPGQLFRVWHVVTRGPAPWAWQPGWWTGYPELQFYPPGFAYAGALLYRLAAGAVSVAVAYQTLVWLAYLAPGVTTFFALARLTGSGWLALPGAFLALTFSDGATSGVGGGVHVGMLGARLAWALIPLLLLALVRWVEAGGRPPWLAAPLAAAILLLHPAELPAAVVLLALAALARAPRSRRLAAVAFHLALAAALTAFWWLPLLVRLGGTRALAWGEPPGVDAFGGLLALPALLALVRARAAGRPALVVALLPWAMAAVTALDRLALEPLGLRWLPANRVVDGAWVALILAAGLGWSGTRPHARAPGREVAVAAAGIALLGLASLRPGALVLWPRAAEWPTLEATTRGLRLDALWDLLRRAPEGRVLFVRSSVPLVAGTAWYRPHTHVTALTPLMAGREIVNGTFTHPSPTAALVYRGDAGPSPISELVEQLDGRSLFGRPLEALEAATFDAYAERLAVSVVVVLEDDLPRVRWLDGNPHWAPPIATPPFLVYMRRTPLALPREVEPGRWRIGLAGAPGEWVSARLAYYPLWRAEAGGVALETRRGALGELEVRRAGSGPVDLVYGPGAPEYAGVVITLAGLAVWSILAWRSRAAERR